MINIHTKTIEVFKDHLKWCCYATIRGYDYSFEDPNIEVAQNQMRDKLKELNIPEEAPRWTEPKPIQRKEKANRGLGWLPLRIDNNPFA